MNEDQLKGKWKQLKGSLKESFGKFTNDDLDEIDGKREKLVGKIQEKYGDTREEAERKIDAL
ncbi:CsbD family protein [Kiritimatiellota bacterium B12222]|nr:CsbD family protein [Kiritimatiellota bacterium B12222]